MPAFDTLGRVWHRQKRKRGYADQVRARFRATRRGVDARIKSDQVRARWTGNGSGRRSSATCSRGPAWRL